MTYLSIVIPTYNEAERLPETLVLVYDFLSRQPYASEVLVVDDGSSDATVQKARESQARFPNLVLIENAVNRGKGAVVRQGMLAATGQYRLFMDADQSTPIAEVDKLLAETAAYQVVIGSRYIHPGSIKLKQPLRRRLLSRLSNWLIQQAVLPGIKDTQCGFKLFSAEAAERIFPLQTMVGWSFDFELLTIARQQGYAIKEVPVDWFDDKRSTLRAAQAIRRSLGDLWTVRQKARGRAYQ